MAVELQNPSQVEAGERGAELRAPARFYTLEEAFQRNCVPATVARYSTDSVR